MSEGCAEASDIALLPLKAPARAGDIGAVLPDEDYAAILSVPDAGTPRGKRDRAIVMLMGNLGLRASDVARRVSDFARVMDPSLPELPRGLMGKVKERVTPYVYTDEEVSLLMSCASRFFRQDPLRTMALEFSIGLMRSCGLRPCEVEALGDGDFDADAGVLTIRNSKNGKSRIVPLGESTACAVAAYRDMRDAARPDASCARMVLGTGGRPMTAHVLEVMFAELRMVLLDRGQMWERRPPRLMDLRHTFAVRTIMRWHAEGADVNAMMPVLSRFMGHDSISETYWYLTGAPELMELAAEAFEAHFGGWPR